MVFCVCRSLELLELLMLVQQGAQRSNAVDRRLACTLAGVAGALNAAAFYAVGFFSANMTGNVSTLSDHLAVGQYGSAAFYAGIVVAFIAGATASSILINSGYRRNYKGVYALVVLLEAVLLACLSLVDLGLSTVWRVPCVVIGLAFLMGLQNAVVTRISEARVRTTHVSGMATDIGIELGLLIDAIRKKGTGAETPAVIDRLRLHVETILCFLGGGALGVILYRQVAGHTFWIAAAVLAAFAGISLRKAQRLSQAAVERPLPNDL
jgi:uncharacterized membrane protein YoaK (UPF0700 family)